MAGTEALTKAREEVVEILPSKDARGNFTQEAAFQTWRAIARNEQYTGETETFGFSNGEAVIPGLPRSASCQRTSEACAALEQPCRMHDRIKHLNNLANYPSYDYVRVRGVTQARQASTYRILSETEYDAEFGNKTADSPFGEEVVDEEL